MCTPSTYFYVQLHNGSVNLKIIKLKRKSTKKQTWQNTKYHQPTPVFLILKSGLNFLLAHTNSIGNFVLEYYFLQLETPSLHLLITYEKEKNGLLYIQFV